jgi:peptidoglycan/LPS O-acetylase OafA/YrhL
VTLLEQVVAGMTPYDVPPFFAYMAVILLLVASSLFRIIDPAPDALASRIPAIDGLRGLLAFAVFFHHATIYHAYLTAGVWQLPPSRFYALIGQVGVGFFFMITGYLFWSRAVAARGRLDWSRFFIGRIFRIGPLYWVAVTAMLAVVFQRSAWHLNLPVSSFMHEIVQLFALGLFGFDRINGDPGASLVLAGVTWTLHYEWLFYLSLPILAQVARFGRLHLVFVVTALAGCLIVTASHVYPASRMPGVCATLFLGGMLSASLRQAGYTVRLNDRLSSAAVIGILGVVLTSFDSGYNLWTPVFLTAAFYLFTNGTSLFGLLTTRAARRLGDISYGIYLLQGLVFAAVFGIGRGRDFALASVPGYWMVIALCALLLLVLATVMHLIVERPGIELGKRLCRKLVRNAEPDGHRAMIRQPILKRGIGFAIGHDAERVRQHPFRRGAAGQDVVDEVLGPPAG